jgi:hypothetical protein
MMNGSRFKVQSSRLRGSGFRLFSFELSTLNFELPETA